MKQKYTKKENAQYRELQLHLRVLSERTKYLREMIRRKKKVGYYNVSDPARVLAKVKKAKKQIADAVFV